MRMNLILNKLRSERGFAEARRIPHAINVSQNGCIKMRKIIANIVQEAYQTWHRNTFWSANSLDSSDSTFQSTVFELAIWRYYTMLHALKKLISQNISEIRTGEITTIGSRDVCWKCDNLWNIQKSKRNICILMRFMLQWWVLCVAVHTLCTNSHEYCEADMRKFLWNAC